MKIIANIDMTRSLAEISTEELALLHGYKSLYGTGFNVALAKSVGAEVPIEEMAEISYFVRTLRPNVLANAKELLTQALQVIEDAENELIKLELFQILTKENTNE